MGGEVCTIIGERLRARRRAAGLSREKLAQELNIPVETVAAFEEARQRVHLRTLYDLCAIFGTPISYFFTVPQGGSGIREDERAPDGAQKSASTEGAACDVAPGGPQQAAATVGDLANLSMGVSAFGRWQAAGPFRA